MYFALDIISSSLKEKTRSCTNVTIVTKEFGCIGILRDHHDSIYLIEKNTHITGTDYSKKKFSYLVKDKDASASFANNRLTIYTEDFEVEN